MPEESPQKKLLGSILVDAGLITSQQLDRALQQQKEHGGKLGYTLVRLGLISASSLGSFLQEHFGIGVASSELPERQKAAGAFPRHLALYYKIAPIKLENDTLTVAISHIEHPNLLETLSEVSGYRVDPIIYPDTEVKALIEECYKLPSITGVEVYTFGENVFTIVDAKKQIKALAVAQLKSERDVGEWLRSIIAEAIKEKSREILIQPDAEKASVLFKKDTFFLSELEVVQNLLDDLTFFLFRLSKMDPMQQHNAQNGRFLVKIHDRKVLMMVSTFPTIYGMRFLLEMFDERLLKHSYDDLTSPELREALQSFFQPGGRGMCVITGPERSGRTSFFYSFLTHAKERFRQIVTLEHLVRYPLAAISQSQVEERELESALENVLKQKPDLVAVNSIRTVRAAELAFLIASRVPLIAVMPSYDCYMAIEWLCRHHLRSAIKAGLVHTIVSPRLMPRPCPNCSTIAEVTLEQKTKLRIPEDAKMRMNQGCDFCRDSEEEFSQHVFEFLRMDADALSWMADSPSASAIRRKARAAGRKTLLDIVIPQAAQGNL
ncbi:MAG TPA: ATPase, T2SS/T4P/T4SS family, partial [Acidobacteriota bacterium]|nr:ATPase, T2SS/T4P/T4SS family [Acidobacteriota bacterium]